MDPRLHTLILPQSNSMDLQVFRICIHCVWNSTLCFYYYNKKDKRHVAKKLEQRQRISSEPASQEQSCIRAGDTIHAVSVFSEMVTASAKLFSFLGGINSS